MFYNILRMEHQKNVQRPFLWIIISILVGVLILMVGLFLLIAFMSPIGKTIATPIIWPQGPLFGLSPLPSVGKILLIILVSVMVTREFSWRTIQLWLSQGLPRPMLLVAKWLILVGNALFITLVALGVSSLLTLLCSFIIAGTVHVEQLDVVRIVLSYFRIFFTLLPYISLTFLLAIATRSTAAALSLSLVYAIVVEPVLESLMTPISLFVNEQLARVIAYLPGGLAQSVETLNATSQQAGASPLQASPMAAAIGIALYTLGFLGLALFSFQRQDLTQ